MRTIALGESGIAASVIGIGTWAIGGWQWGGTDEAASIRAIHAALDAGCNLIDTAPIYGFGLSERIVGRAIADRRDEVVLATKCGLLWDSKQGKQMLDDGEHCVHLFLGPDSIRREVVNSLERLGVDAIDLYQTHWQDTTTAVEDSMATLLELVDEGKIRAIGVSNCSVETLLRYRELGLIASMQEKYNLLDRKLEKSVLPYADKHRIAVLAYSPMARGALITRGGADRVFPDGDLRRRDPLFRADAIAKREPLIRTLGDIANSHDATVSAVVLAWTIAQPGITHVLCGTRSVEQSRMNAAAADLMLTDDELAQIERASVL